MPRKRKPEPTASRRSLLASAAGAAAAITVAPLERLSASASLDTNVILIVCDALRADRLGCHGYRNPKSPSKNSPTPNIDKLAASGVLYENCIAQSSWTQTSMTSMLYSAWPVLKGDKHTFAYVPEDAAFLKNASPGLHRLAVQANPYLKQPIYRRPFDDYGFIHQGDYAPAGKLNDAFDWKATPIAQDGRKFLAYIHYMDPHEPYNYKHRFRRTLSDADWTYFHPLALCGRVSSYHDDTGKLIKPLPPVHVAQLSGTGDAYDEDIQYLDLMLAGLFNHLKRLRITDQTTIILTADHGQSFGEHGWCGHKQTLYQEEIHVPLIIAGPGIPAATRVAAQVRGVDILPTIAALAGTSIPGLVGAPLLPAARVEAAGNRLAYSCCDYAKYGKVLRLLTCLVTPDRMKYVRILTQERELLREELYDLNTDPHETRDLVKLRPGDVKAQSAQMTEFESAAFWRAPKSDVPEMDDETKKQLEALGYI